MRRINAKRVLVGEPLDTARLGETLLPKDSPCRSSAVTRSPRWPTPPRRSC
ncbi:hypothetical protein WKI68_40420 [Streptomyces sp. MS1.HAVA.3]|uniref:Uncharacterized protein n=1 Tax=Streptomyces caledonius TaxID=3134107 RepID=A0ABU8UF95_9ACTN